ncbi:hypothetical protein JMJ35_006721 [Cladonia borealis]|uniref:Ankyrin repeat protein n=1 Tax=Cladonia borealis TaxID=184061 RepID=A0AA39V4E4_9LECA|nr:hypothetical protein JMJ35_006721 [Cladonia borealis]
MYPFLAYSASNLFQKARRLEIVGNISSYAYIKEVLTPKFGPVHVAVCKRFLTECVCGNDFIWERYPYNATSPFAHGLPKTCEEVIGTYTGDESFSIDEALNEAILGTSIRPHEPNFLRYDLNTLSLVLSKITQIKQSHLERAMAVPAPVHVLKLLLGHRSAENLQIFTDDGRNATLLWLLVCSDISLTNYTSLTDTLKFLIEEGEDLNEPCGSDGTALDYAVRRENDITTALIIKALVYCGAYKTINSISLSKPIKLIDGSGMLRVTTLREYLAGEDGFDPGHVESQKVIVEEYLSKRAVMPT